MSLLIGVPRETSSRREAGRDRARGRREADQAGLQGRRRSGRRRRGADQRRRLPRRGRRDRRGSRRSCGRCPTSSSRCARRAATKSACCARAARWSASSGRRRTPSCCSSSPRSKATVLAMDSVPRISRAQKLDALSSMANIAGYRAVIEAAHEFGRFFTGRSPPRARCRRPRSSSSAPASRASPRSAPPSGLGAIVRANDTRPEVADQVKSLGGEFVAGRLRGGRERRRRLRQGDERGLPEGRSARCSPSRRRTSTSSSRRR